SLNEGISWVDVETKTPTQCVTTTYSWAYCSYNCNRYAKDFKSINNTGRTSVVDIWSIVAGRYMGEVTLYDNETAYHYNVPAGDFKYYIRYLDYDNHTLSDTYTVSRCGEHSMTWTSSKMANSEKSNMVKDSNPYLPFESLGTPSIKK
ncbi:MAG: hypothetical protein PHU27_05670, partial [Salinivirgaceae bacterium]|nr:hypothetical protein [Salinivirgaceae bacterium]